MEGANNMDDFSSKVGGSPLILILVGVAVVAVIGSAVFFSLQKAAVSGENDKIDAEIVSLKNEISLLEGEKVEAARTAQVFLAKIKEEEIIWSRVISRIQSLIPYDGTTQEAKVNFLSYSGAAGGKININATSRNTTKDPLDDVAEVISVFNDSSYFKNAIIPSVSVGENDRGEKSASFALMMDYLETAPLEITAPEAAAAEETDDAGIPRQ